MQKLLIATGNPGKFREISELFEGLDGLRLFSVKDLGLSGEGLVEDGETFAENARKKARFFYDKVGFLTLAEDSGLCVNVLGDELGVQTRRWGAGHDASDEEWIEYFLNRMEGEKDREAHFICNACLVGDGVEEFFEGETRGVITENLQAPILSGLPLSSCFLPEGCGKVYASLGAKKKNEVSHRGKAIAQVRGWIINNII